MANGDLFGPEDKRPVKKKPAKKPYAKPSFRFERVFETQALSCGKIGAISTQCKLNSKNS